MFLKEIVEKNENDFQQKKRKQKEAKEASTHCFAKCASGQRIGDLRKRARLLSYKKEFFSKMS